MKSLKETRRDQILKSAEKVFSDKGFLNSTISDVAKETGVSDTTIYEYFSSKEELLFSIPREGIELSKEILDAHLNYISGASNKLRAMIYHLCKFYQENPYFASICLMTLKTNKKFMETDIYKDLKEYYKIIINVVEEGIHNGELRKDINPHFVRSIIIGSIEFIVIRWLMYGCPEGQSQPMNNVEPLFKIIMGGIKKDRKMTPLNLKIKIEPDEWEDTQ